MSKEKKIPVIFIHRGFPEYLKYTIACAKEHKNKVILIGDDENKCIGKNWFSIEQYKSDLFENFREVYIHLSPNSKWFELVCFERYFVLLEFMKRNRINQCIMLDSDVLLFERIDTLRVLYEYEMCGGCEDRYKQVNPCVLYWTIFALEEFIQFCLLSYQDNNRRYDLLNYYREKREKREIKLYGGVSDMVLLYFWTKTTTCKNENFFSNKFDFFIDGNYGYAEQNRINYKMRKKLGIKKIEFKNKKPYIECPFSRKRKKILAIHFSGDAKKYIRTVYKCHASVMNYYISLAKSIV